MKIRYLGPSQAVEVGGYGRHYKDAVKDYPDDVGEELLKTSKRQWFEAVDTEGEASDRAAGATRLAEMVAATAQAVADGSVTGSGAPTVETMETILGYNITAAERDAAFAAWQQQESGE